jgi:DNA-binding MarR family transcriptional regulator
LRKISVASGRVSQIARLFGRSQIDFIVISTILQFSQSSILVDTKFGPKSLAVDSGECMHIQLSMSLDGKILDTKSIEGVCLGGCVRKLNRMVSAIYDSALADAGLKTSQFSVLVSVANRKQARPAELIKNLQLDESTLSRNVERMCARGWLRLVQDSDRRSHLIEVTDKGQALIRKCIPAWQKAQAEVSRRLGNESVGELRTALRKLSARN